MNTEGMFIIVEPKPGRYYLGAWYCWGSIEHPDEDWFGAVFKDNGGDWHLRYRHKYYNSADPFDPKDERSNYEMTCAASTPEVEILEKIEQIVDVMAAVRGFKRDSVYFRTEDAEAIIDRFRGKKWAHMKVMER